MKLLHVAVFTPTSTNIWQAAAFATLGHDVVRYDYRRRAGEVGNIERDKELIELCRSEKPDLILFSKCNQMDVSVVRECGKVGTTALWYMDPVGNIDSELILKMKTCDYIFSWRWDGFREGKKHCKNTYRIFEGYDRAANAPVSIPKTRDACFIGSMRQFRNQYKNAAKFDVVTGAYGRDHAVVVSETKVNLNFTEGDGSSDRVLKVMAAGGFLLTNPWENMENEFEVGKDLQVFRRPEELQELINYYVNHEDEREAIAKCGMETVKQYDDINYARSILEAIGYE